MNQTSKLILSHKDVQEMLDSMLRDSGPWWDFFYEDRTKKVPFFVHVPDENLKQYMDSNLIPIGKVLELGCGPGRNAIYLAEQGCQVDAVDISSEAIKWARERAKDLSAVIEFLCCDIFSLPIQAESYEFVYDSGCFHHIAPHRRMSYVELVSKALQPGGHFALSCFTDGPNNPATQGSMLSDWDVYKLGSLKGGLGYSPDKLKAIFHEFEPIEIRKMKKIEQPAEVFGESFLWTALFRKKT
jgi:SAM-dependent methyltransferase